MTGQIALIGFGEAAATFAKAAGWNDRACAYDIDAARRTAMNKSGVAAAPDAASALANAELVLSLVTADQALPVARSCAGVINPGTRWFDMNSVAPETKRRAAAAIELAGAHYVDAAILAPVHPARLDVPILLSGPTATMAQSQLSALGFASVRVVGEEIGRASSIKMIRSVMVKGVEALTAEMMAAATAAGVVDEVLESLDGSERDDRWAVRAEYNLERMAQHGMRRAAEMEEVAKTLVSVGVEPVMTESTIRRQREAAQDSGPERATA